MSDDTENAAAEPEQSPDDGATAATTDDATDGTGDDLVARVAEHDEGLANEVADRLAELEGEVDARTDQLKRTQADFQNYKKRAKKRQDQMEQQATEGLVERLLDVRDNLNRALESDHEDVESLQEGVEMTLREFDRVLSDENVSEIAPDTGSEVDPQRHEVLMRVESDHDEGTVAEVYQSGYEMGEKVLRAAQVTVSDGNDDGE